MTLDCTGYASLTLAEVVEMGYTCHNRHPYHEWRAYRKIESTFNLKSVISTGEIVYLLAEGNVSDTTVVQDRPSTTLTVTIDKPFEIGFSFRNQLTLYDADAMLLYSIELFLTNISHNNVKFRIVSFSKFYVSMSPC